MAENSSLVTHKRGSTRAPVRKRLRFAPEARERMILEAAIEFFAEEGFNAQMRLLAERIGVSQALIFKYFRSKDELIDRVYREIFLSRWKVEWERLIRDRSRPLSERLHAFLSAYLDAVDDRRWIRIAMHASLAGHDLTRRYIATHVTRLLQHLVTEILAESGASGRGVEDDPLLLELAWHLQSTVIYYLIRKHVHNTPVAEDKDAFLDLIIGDFLEGLKVVARGSAPARAGRTKRRKELAKPSN